MPNSEEQLLNSVTQLMSLGMNASEEFVGQVSSRYAEEADRINQRLTKAKTLLTKGLRDEAIQECEREPNLLDQFESLEIPNLELWYSIHTLHGLPVPCLNYEDAAELNEAYAHHAPLKSLLEKHRMLALAHAPLDSRITLLRQIAAKDPSNDVWRDDISTFESERLRQIRVEVDRQITSPNPQAIENLRRELANSTWSIEVPEKLKIQTAKLVSLIRKNAARRKLRELSDELIAAHGEFDVARGIKLLAGWEGCLIAAALPTAHETTTRTQPALEWIQEQRNLKDRAEASKQVLAQLTTALEVPQTTPQEIEGLRHKLRSLGVAMPPVVGKRCDELLAASDLRAKRQLLMRLVGIVAVVVLIAGFTTSWVRTARFKAEVGGKARELAEYRVGAMWADGKRLIALTEDAAPELFRSLDFQREVQDFNDAFNRSQGRTNDRRAEIDDIMIEGVSGDELTRVLEVEKRYPPISEKEEAEYEEMKSKARRDLDRRDDQDRTERQKVVDSISKALEVNKKPPVGQLNLMLQQLEEAKDSFPRRADVHDEWTLLYKKLSSMIGKINDQSRSNLQRQQLLSAVGNTYKYDNALNGLIDALERGNRPDDALEADGTKDQLPWELIRRLLKESESGNLDALDELINAFAANEEPRNSILEPRRNMLLAKPVAAKRATIAEGFADAQWYAEYPPRWAEKVQGTYDKLSRPKPPWVKEFSGLIDDVYGAPELNDVSKFTLVSNLIANAASGSHWMALGYSEWLGTGSAFVSKDARKERRTILFADWKNPRPETLEAASRFLRILPTPDQCLERSKELFSKQRSLSWIGFIDIDRELALAETQLPETQQTGDLYTVKSENDRLRFISFGKLENGILKDPAPNRVNEIGGPVFLIFKAKK